MTTSFAKPLSNPLGKGSCYVAIYDPKLLFPIARQDQRDEIGITGELPFHGDDIWNAYELSWLNSRGKPIVARAVFTLPATSPRIIESKSFKLYLNSLNQTKFVSVENVQRVLERDLSEAIGAVMKVDIIEPAQFSQQTIEDFDGICIDHLDVMVNDYIVNTSLLKCGDEEVEEVLVSHILKSNCLVTNQPDWASVQIKYRGKKILHDALLKYLISFRNHNEFGEHCVERIFMDLMKFCQPTQLTVYARYTRRGGLDINPFRSNFETKYTNLRLGRQ